MIVWLPWQQQEHMNSFAVLRTDKFMIGSKTFLGNRYLQHISLA